MEVAFGILSGGLQAAAYLYYLAKARQRQIAPNPTSWLMWGYGTTLIFALELDSGATAAMLVLPAVCAVSSVAVAVLCWQHGTLRWPRERWERRSLHTDLALTAAYVATWALMTADLLPAARKDDTDIALLVIGNLSALVTFVPMLRETWREPDLEHPGPWIVWATAYLALGLATVCSLDWTWHLLLYPALCFVLHVAVALVCRRIALVHLFHAGTRAIEP